MRPEIAALQEEALRTSFEAERVSAAVVKAANAKGVDLIALAKRKSDRHLLVAGAGLVTATGLALIGGPEKIGVAAFIASATAAGSSAYHLVTARLHELREAIEAKSTGHARPLTAEERRDLVQETAANTERIWNEANEKMRQDLMSGMSLHTEPSKSGSAAKP